MTPPLLLDLFADLTLGAILIFLGRLRRDDRHALFWGCGQILLGLAAVEWSISAHNPVAYALVAACTAYGLLGYVAGTRHFCGAPLRERSGLLPASLGALVAFAVLVLAPPLGAMLVLAGFAVVLGWCGWRLNTHRHAYRLVGLILMLRGANNGLIAFTGLSGTAFEVLLLFAFVCKTASALGLIYAVLHENEHRFRAMLNTLAHGVVIRDALGVVHFASDKMAEYLGCGSAREIEGRDISAIAPRQTKERAEDWFRRVTEPGAKLPLVDEGVLRRGDGTEFPVEIISIPYSERGQPRILTQMMDIRERKRQEEVLFRAANIDEVSGLLNRRALNRTLQAALAAPGSAGQECALLFIDLDHFKRINDSLGHSAGDLLLTAVSRQLESIAPPGGILARFGGDEFVMALPGLAAGMAVAEGEKLAAAVLAIFVAPIRIEAMSCAITPSIGIAVSPAHGNSAEALLGCADQAMYAAKKGGRNRFCVFDQRMAVLTRDWLQIDEALRYALAHDEFQLVFQPIVSTRTRRLQKVEALLRWRSASLGTMPPDRFIPVAEESGLIVDIGSWVLQQACRQIAAWRSGPLAPVVVSVNVSAWQFVDPRFVDQVREALAREAIPPHLLELEITERVMLEDEARVQAALHTLHEVGVTLSLDDFGTGYSSLSYLARFQLNTLKLDRSFVSHIDHDPRQAALARAVIGIGHSLGLQVVAEGVETEIQASLLAAEGCELLQGYLVSRPLDTDTLEQFVRSTGCTVRAGAPAADFNA